MLVPPVVQFCLRSAVYNQGLFTQIAPRARPICRPINSDVASANFTLGRITVRARYARSRIENAE